MFTRIENDCWEDKGLGTMKRGNLEKAKGRFDHLLAKSSIFDLERIVFIKSKKLRALTGVFNHI